MKEDDNGIYRWASGKYYEGPFREGFLEGYGTLKWDEASYQGKFERGVKVGDEVKMTTAVGDYTGQYVNG